MEPIDNSFDDLLNSVHKEGVTLFESNNTKIPCILLRNERFNEIAKSFYEKSYAVDSKLNILHDDKKHVFVEIVLMFSKARIEQRILIYANKNLEFFEILAESAIIGILPESDSQTESNILMIQLARKDEVKKALGIINFYLK
ncbi:MAG: hypothetical protein CMO16_05020 [Thaumarchaeota archaeon]|nr:hypothetical protein [Nitrososphaerota archaeon]